MYCQRKKTNWFGMMLYQLFNYLVQLCKNISISNENWCPILLQNNYVLMVLRSLNLQNIEPHEPYPVFWSRRAGNWIFKYVQAQMPNKTTVRKEWKLKSADWKSINNNISTQILRAMKITAQSNIMISTSRNNLTIFKSPLFWNFKAS